MNRLCSLLMVVTVVAGLRAEARAWACETALSIPHTIDPAMQAIDHTPPTLPAIPAPKVWFEPSEPQGCDCGTCSESSIIRIPAVATDDMTPPGRIGYRLSLVSGNLPPEVVLPATAVEPIADFIRLNFDSETTFWFNFTLEVVAIDLAGNESLPQTVVVLPPGGDSECSVSTARASRPGLGWIVLLALIVAAYHRRRVIR